MKASIKHNMKKKKTFKLKLKENHSKNDKYFSSLLIKCSES